MKTLKVGIELDLENNLYEQILNHVKNLPKGDYVLFNVINFTKLNTYEKQTEKNFIVIEKNLDNTYTVFDNIDYREKHEIEFLSSEKVSEYIANLLNSPTVIDFAQYRTLKERDVELNFGDLVVMSKKYTLTLD